jgi:hypothetical protein
MSAVLEEDETTEPEFETQSKTRAESTTNPETEPAAASLVRLLGKGLAMAEQQRRRGGGATRRSKPQRIGGEREIARRIIGLIFS